LAIVAGRHTHSLNDHRHLTWPLKLLSIRRFEDLHCQGLQLGGADELDPIESVDRPIEYVPDIGHRHSLGGRVSGFGELSDHPNEVIDLVEKCVVRLEPLVAVPNPVLLAVGFARCIGLSARRQNLRDDRNDAGQHSPDDDSL